MSTTHSFTASMLVGNVSARAEPKSVATIPPSVAGRMTATGGMSRPPTTGIHRGVVSPQRRTSPRVSSAAPSASTPRPIR